MSLAEGEWNLSYGSNGIHPGANFTFGSIRSGYYLLEPYEIAHGETDTGDTPLPRADGIRFGQDYRSAATITFEIGVDAVDDATTQRARHGANLNRLSVMGQAWDAEALRRRFATPAVLSTVQGGRGRRFYGRPRKWAPAGSKLTRQGYTPVVATFACQDATAYDEVEQRTRVDIAPPPHRGLVGPLTTPLTMTGESSGKVAGVVMVGGTRPTWPLITIYGPITQPVCEVVGRWKVSLDLTLGEGEQIVIDPRPWARTVLRNGSASVAGSLYRGSPRLEEMRLPIGRQDFVLRGTDLTGTAYMTIAWRDAYAYL
ncbi:hypothetical protein [Streptomyces noursei]|uniref:hypothetical protein n=1 Tax=Streptomyces noursei TaxID=1971 RepID=UPI0016793E3E|nr:hypothetical protein [Streptomyces noursei]MCZ1014473.1 hypothetical protein [Streptomyces noursei]GGW95305.1 hypothetical protein GCM10010341_15620 [Streptomyces noursei]